MELAATTSQGEIHVITEMTRQGDTLLLTRLQIDGPGARSVGLQELRKLATDLARQQGANRMSIHGGVRTTGANPGHPPRPITFSVGDWP